ETAGRVVRLAVEEGQTIHKGDLIAELAADELRATLLETQAKVAEIDADLRYLEWKVQNVTQLFGSAAASAQELREHERHLAVARARRQAAEASARRIEAQLAKAIILSLIDGTVTARAVNPGEMV